jgi:hypothetical protein
MTTVGEFADGLRARLAERRRVIDPVYQDQGATPAERAARIAACDAQWNPAFAALLRDVPSDEMLKACVYVVGSQFANAATHMNNIMPVIDPQYAWAESDMRTPDTIRAHTTAVANEDWRVSRNAHLLQFITQVSLRLQAAAIARVPFFCVLPIVFTHVVGLPIVPREDVPADFECCVCMETNANLSVLRGLCGHLVHSTCLKNWYAAAAHATDDPLCVVCRQKITGPIAWGEADAK